MLGKAVQPFLFVRNILFCIHIHSILCPLKADCVGCVSANATSLMTITLKFMWYSFVDHIDSCTVLNFMLHFVENLHVHFQTYLNVMCQNPLHSALHMPNFRAKSLPYSLWNDLIFLCSAKWVVTFFSFHTAPQSTFMFIFSSRAQKHVKSHHFSYVLSRHI